VDERVEQPLVDAGERTVDGVVGGVLTTGSWRLTFLVNVPLTLLCAVGAAGWIRTEGGPDRTGRVPVLASGLATGTVVALVLGLTLGAERGWGSLSTVGCVALAGVLGATFVRNERGSRNVLIEPVLRDSRSLRLGAVAAGLYMASVGSEFYVLTLLLQTVKGYSPLQTGWAFLPLALFVTVGSMTAGRAVRRFGSAGVLTGGFAIASFGLSWLSITLDGDSYLGDLLPGLVLSGLGHGMIFTSMFVLGTRDIPGTHQGRAGALLTTSQYVGGAVTVAGLTLVLGPDPDAVSFQAAFLVITGAAAAGAVLVAARRRTLDAHPSCWAGAAAFTNTVPRSGQPGMEVSYEQHRGEEHQHPGARQEDPVATRREPVTGGRGEPGNARLAAHEETEHSREEQPSPDRRSVPRTNEDRTTNPDPEQPGMWAQDVGQRTACQVSTRRLRLASEGNHSAAGLRDRGQSEPSDVHPAGNGQRSECLVRHLPQDEQDDHNDGTVGDQRGTSDPHPCSKAALQRRRHDESEQRAGVDPGSEAERNPQ
jgi:MFS family permease